MSAFSFGPERVRVRQNPVWHKVCGECGRVKPVPTAAMEGAK